MLKTLFLSTFILLVSCVTALFVYLFLFRASVLPNSIPRLDIQRYDSRYENILVIGDSFFDPRNHNIFELQTDLLKKKKVNLINVSETNTGPYHYLYALETYLSHYKFNKVILIFYGGNDLVDLHLPIDKEDFQKRLQKRMQFWEAVKLTVRDYGKRLLNLFQPSRDKKEIIYENLNRNKDSLLINDLFLNSEKSKKTFNIFVNKVKDLKDSTDLKIGCLFIPPSRQVDNELFGWWKGQKINWDNKLEYNARAYNYMILKFPQFCNWFIEDLTPDIKDMISKKINPYLKNDNHFHPDRGHRILLEKIRAALD